MVVVASSWAPEVKIVSKTNVLKNLKLKGEYIFPARFHKEFIKIKCDLCKKTNTGGPHLVRNIAQKIFRTK